MKKIQSKARSSRDNAVAIADILANQLDKGDLAAFEKASPGRFTKGFPQALRAKALEVDNLPLARSRQASRTDAVIDLEKLLPDVLIVAQFTADYIKAGFPADEYDRRLDQCGYKSYYTSASRSNWASVKSLGTNLLAFVKEYEGILTTGDNMPPAFPEEMKGVFDAFNAKHKLLNTAKSGLVEATNENTSKLNELNAMLSGVFKIAQAIYLKDPVKRSFYTMASCLKMVKPPQPGGVRGGLVDAVSRLPIAGAKIVMPFHNMETKSDAKGRFAIKLLPDGIYMVRVEADGYAPVEIADIAVRTSTLTTLKPLPLKADPGDGTATVERFSVNGFLPKTRTIKPAPDAQAPEQPLSVENDNVVEMKLASEPVVKHDASGGEKAGEAMGGN